MTRSQKMYVCVIYGLGRGGLPVRSADVSDILGVSRSNTVRMTRRLAAEGFLLKLPYRELRLSERGSEIGERLFRYRAAIEKLLRDRVGLDRELARRESLSIAAELSEETLGRLADYIEKT